MEKRKRKRGRPKGSITPHTQNVIDLLSSGVRQTEIANLLGYSRQAINQTARNYDLRFRELRKKGVV